MVFSRAEGPVIVCQLEKMNASSPAMHANSRCFRPLINYPMFSSVQLPYPFFKTQLISAPQNAPALPQQARMMGSKVCVLCLHGPVYDGAYNECTLVCVCTCLFVCSRMCTVWISVIVCACLYGQLHAFVLLNIQVCAHMATNICMCVYLLM